MIKWICIVALIILAGMAIREMLKQEPIEENEYDKADTTKTKADNTKKIKSKT